MNETKTTTKTQKLKKKKELKNLTPFWNQVQQKTKMKQRGKKKKIAYEEK